MWGIVRRQLHARCHASQFGSTSLRAASVGCVSLGAALLGFAPSAFAQAAADAAVAAPAPAPAPAPEPSKPALSLEELGVAQPNLGLTAATDHDATDYNASAPSRSPANFLWPLLDVIGVNFAFWGISYASGAPFAKITPKIWKENFGTGFQW